MELVTEIFVKLLSVSTMLNLGLNTTKQDFGKSLNWRTLGAPLFLSLIALPVIALSLLWFLGEKSDLTLIGLTIAVASAGGSSAGIFVKAVRGSESLSGGLVVIQSLISSLYLPVLLGLTFSKSSVIGTTLTLVIATSLYQILPFTVGFFSSKHFTKSGPSLQRLSKFNSLALAILIVGFAFQSFGQITQISQASWITIITINALAFFGSGLFLDISRSLIPTISATVGIRNLTMALLILSAFGASSVAQAPILMYGLVMYLFAGLRLAFDLKTASELI